MFHAYQFVSFFGSNTSLWAPKRASRFLFKSTLDIFLDTCCVLRHRFQCSRNMLKQFLFVSRVWKEPIIEQFLKLLWRSSNYGHDSRQPWSRFSFTSPCSRQIPSAVSKRYLEDKIKWSRIHILPLCAHSLYVMNGKRLYFACIPSNLFFLLFI